MRSAGYNFIAAGDFDRSYGDLKSSLHHAEYCDLAGPFASSIDRVVFLYELPPQLIFWTGVFTSAKIFARCKNNVDPEDISHDKDPKVQDTAMQMLRDVETRGCLEKGSHTLSAMLGDLGAPGVDDARHGVEAALAAMVMAAYAAFETLAADAWVTAVNKHVELASNWAAKNEDKKAASMKDMIDWQWNMSGSAGTFLHKTRRVSFESLKDIRTLYSHTFKGGLDYVFDPADGLIKAEKTRHLFAHRGGLIDRKFKDEMERFPEYESIKIGERLRITGPLTAAHVNACVSSGIKLLQALDKWSLTRS